MKTKSFVIAILFALVARTAFCQLDPASAWNSVDSLINKQYFSQAYQQSEKMMEWAMKNNNSRQCLVASVYMSRTGAYFMEDYTDSSLARLERLMPRLDNVDRSICLLFLAKQYADYYRANRWRIGSNAQEVESGTGSATDYTLWSGNRFRDTVEAMLHRAFANPGMLQNVPSEELGKLVEVDDGKDGNLTPTLYDVAVALMSEIVKKMDFDELGDKNMDHPELFYAEAERFVTMTVTARSESQEMMRFYVEQLQRQEAYHLQRGSSDAVMIELYIRRVENKEMVTYGKNFETEELPNVIAHYRKGNNEHITQLYYRLALNYKQDERYVNAIKAIDTAIKLHPQSPGAVKCLNMRGEITQKEIHFRTLDASPSDRHQLGWVSARNMDHLYFRIIKWYLMPDADSEKEQRERMLKQKALREWDLALPKRNDYEHQRSYFTIPQMPQGDYFLLVSSEPTFATDAVAISKFRVEDVVFVTAAGEHGGYAQRGFVLERVSGKPVAGIEVTLSAKNSYKDEYHYVTSVTTDKDGFYDFTDYVNANYDKTHKFYSSQVSVKYKGKEVTLRSNQLSRNERYSNSKEPDDRYFFDRPIYKPGDTVGFAYLAYRSSLFDGNVETGNKVTFILYDINDKGVDTLSLVTDEFGVCSGSFALAADATPGSWLIKKKGRYGSSSYFTVEAYKQPKFTVTLTKPKEERSFGKPIRIDGVAASYTTMPVSGAKVEYSIKREEIIPFWRRNWESYSVNGSTIVASSGDDTQGEAIVTDENGLFSITFVPLPDSNSDLGDKPSYRYNVMVKVTDINGETHSAQTSLSLGFENCYASMSEERKSDDDVSLSVSLHNLDGSAISGKLNLEVAQLRQPDRPKMIHSLMEDSDTDIYMPMGIAEFERLFAAYDYDGSANDIQKWPVLKNTFSTQARLTPENPYIYDFKGLKAGIYKVVAVIVSDDGDTARTEQIVEYTPSNAKMPVNSQLLTAAMDKESYEVGDTARLRVGSPYDDVTLLVVMNKKGIVSTHSTHRVSKGFVVIEIPVADTLVGGFCVEVAAVKENQCDMKDFDVTVVRADKKLDVVFETFRDKLEPGDKETWTLRIKDTKTSKPEKASLMLTMYDHALDSYKFMRWSLNPWPNPYNPSTLRDYFSNYSSYYYFKPAMMYHYYNEYTYRTATFVNLLPSYRYNGKHITQLGNVRKRTGVSLERVEMEEEVFVMAADNAIVEKESVIGIGAPESGTRLTAEDIQHMPPSTIDEAGDGNGAADFKSREEERVRTNLSTLAFFKPTLRSAEDGSVEMSFTAPDLLTEWSVMGLAWTKDLKIGTLKAKTITRKRLMVVPNVPRFLRQGDTCVLSVKVSNMSGSEQNINVSLEMLDAVNNNKIRMIVGNTEKTIRLKDGASGEVSFILAVPHGLFVANYKVVARGQGCSDGEQAPIPILPSRQLVTESVAFYINGAGEKHYEMKHLTSLPQSNNNTLTHYSLTVDLTPNPIWMAIQSLPYVQRQKNPSNIYLANAIYTNSLSFDIVRNNPQIEKLFRTWESGERDAFQSELDRNTGLKQTVMEETPWLQDAKDEEQRHRDIARFFNSVTLSRQLQKDIDQLIAAQRGDGGWSWIEGGRYSSLYTTQYILKTLGMLRQLGVELDSKTKSALKKGMDYVDRETYNYYKKYIKNTHFEPVNLDYLYLRSLYADNKMTKQQQEAYDFFYNNAKKHNESYRDLYTQAMLGLVFHRHGDKKLAREMVTRIREKALYSDEMGMYWRDNTGGWRWNERPIETQAMLIRTFAEVTGDYDRVAKMQQWILKQKQTTNWNTDVSTVNAIQALLISENGDKNSGVKIHNSNIKIHFGSHELKTDTTKSQLHISQRLERDEIKPNDGSLTITKADDGIAWGAMYWQYFEDVDKIPASSMGVTLQRTLFKVNADGSITVPQNNLKVGDKVRVRLQIVCDRNLEYIELKDPRCAAFEPVSTKSGWRWNSGLSYYIAVTNTAQTLYIDRLEKGSYIVEYDMYVNNAGTFVTAPTTIQCLYAPEFRALCPIPAMKVER